MKIRTNIGGRAIIGNKVLLIIIVFLMSIVTIHVTLATVDPSYDTEQDCRGCHINSSRTIPTPAIRHHSLVNEGKYGCPDCHPSPINNQQFAERNCLVCHAGKNHTGIHHRLTGHVCTECHPIIYDNQTNTYYTQVIRDCPVCHSTVGSPSI